MGTHYGTEPVYAPIWFDTWERLCAAYARGFAHTAQKWRNGIPPTMTNPWVSPEVIQMPGEYGGFWTAISYEHTAKNKCDRNSNLERWAAHWCGCAPKRWTKGATAIVRACPHHSVNFKALGPSRWFEVDDEISRRRYTTRRETHYEPGIADPVLSVPGDDLRSLVINITGENNVVSFDVRVGV